MWKQQRAGLVDGKAEVFYVVEGQVAARREAPAVRRRVAT